MAEYTTSLAELFNMDPDAYSDIHLTTLPFSLRAVNRFQRSGMNTVSDILLKCPADFMQIVGFGKVSLAEIDTVLSSIQNLVITHPEAMEQKDYNGALGGTELSGISEALTLGQEELCDVLGDEFIAQCQSNPEYVYKLTLTLHQALYKIFGDFALCYEVDGKEVDLNIDFNANASMYALLET